MTRRFTTATIVVLLLVAVVPSQSRLEAADQGPSGQFSVSVECQTFPERGAFLCTAIVSDLPTGEEYLGAQLNGRLADTVKANRSFDFEGTTYRLEIDVTAEESAASFEFRAFRSDQLVAKQAGSVRPGGSNQKS